ncbi:sialate O-acetylesterase [Sulfuriroseicoccus oceanibius]|uniref:Sialate O-acetylesterase domain-containing protein n=1 Tax=Sulfuriroseicoccus oceanibius TaxID=2707525 RepID=A0A7T7EZ66_9BACT|nr:sialate O-acetylesterase [Sulfuriroseicoccus oceanibius]QQL43846.1 hypothetical protein G3M56_008035 [Sulfuriroseicoccus oceanibius]
MMKESIYRVVGLLTLMGVLWEGSMGQSVAAEPLKVFVLVGQSNMQGHAMEETVEHIGMDPQTAPWLERLRDKDGKARVYSDVPVSYLSDRGVKRGALTTGFGADDRKIGPELTFGIWMHLELGEPVLLIKAAWGGKSLHTDFRPPSAGAYEFSERHQELLTKQGKDIEKVETEQREASGYYYRLTVDHVKSVLADIGKVYPEYASEHGYELAGLVWFQGWNDMVDANTYPDREAAGGYDEYTRLLMHLIQDLRRDLSAPELPVVIGVMGVGGPTASYGPDQRRYVRMHQNFRDAMAATAALPGFEGNVVAVRSEEYWDPELGALVARDGKLRYEVKQKKLHGKEAQAALDVLRADEFSQAELETLKKGVSNYPFHYLGSAKILGGIGIAFAEAMLELMKVK